MREGRIWIDFLMNTLRCGPLLEVAGEKRVQQALPGVQLAANLAKELHPAGIGLGHIVCTRGQRLIEQRNAAPVFGEFGKVENKTIPSTTLCRNGLQGNQRLVK